MSTSAPAQEEKRTDSQESLSWKPDGLIGRGRFKLVRFIAQGGMGIVWEAFDTKLKERVAVKTVPAELRSNFPAFDHLRREIVRNRALSHPNIVRIHDLYEEEGEEPFIVMELVDGRGLNEWQAEQDDGVFDWEWFKPFLLQICDALAYAHQRNIVHRDLKPANVLLGADGQIKIIDFGLATHFTDALHPMSRSLGASGTTAYMSPQQVEGWPSTAQDDIYALGATLFELLTGQPPFVGGDLAHQVAHHPPPKLQERIEQLGLNRTISGEAELFVGSCLIKDTAVRPKTVDRLVGLLHGSVETNFGSKSDPEVANENQVGESFANDRPRPRSKRKLFVTLAVLVVTVVCCINAALVWKMYGGFRFFSPGRNPTPRAVPSPSPTPIVPAANAGGSTDGVVQRMEVKALDLASQIGTSLVGATTEPQFKSHCFVVFKKVSGQSVSLMLGPGRWELKDGVLSVRLDRSSDETYVRDSLTEFAEFKVWSADVFVERGTVLFGSHVIKPADDGRIDVLVSQLEIKSASVGPVISETWRVDPSRLGGSTPHWYSYLKAPWRMQGAIHSGEKDSIRSSSWNTVSVNTDSRLRTFSVNGENVGALTMTTGHDSAASFFLRIKGDPSGAATVHLGNLTINEPSARGFPR